MWRYWATVTEGVTVLLNIALGALGVRTCLTPAHIPALNALVFNFLLPCTVIRGLGIKTDLYDGAIWRFAGAFFVLRVFALVLAVAAAAVRRAATPRDTPLADAWLGNLVVDWLGLTWISTIVLGVPMLSVVLGPASAVYPVWASISSFVFQLPVMLVCFELHRFYCERFALPMSTAARTPSTRSSGGGGDAAVLAGGKAHVFDGRGAPQGTRGESAEREAAASPRTRIARVLTAKIVRNPVLWGIVIGCFLSLAKLGPKYLDPGPIAATPTNPHFVRELAWVDELLGWLSACLTPVALFATGMWLASPGSRKNDLLMEQLSASSEVPAEHATAAWRLWLAPIGVRTTVLLVLKFTVIPCLMIGIAKMLDLADGPARAAVLIAALPLAPAAFTLTEEYGLGQAIMTRCIAFGTALLIPVFVIYIEGMDSADLFKVPPFQPIVPVPTLG